MSLFLSVVLLAISGIFISIAIAVWQKGGYANLWHSFFWGIGGFLVLGVAIFFSYYAYVIHPAQPSVKRQLAFSVINQGGVCLVERKKEPWATYWMVFEYDKEALMAAITDMLYIRFTNEQPEAITIDYYAIDIRKTPKDSWVETTCLNRITGQLIQVVKSGANDITLTNPSFDEAVRDVSIVGGGTVKGWVLMERPLGFDKHRELRMRIRDVRGRKGEAMIRPVAKDGEFTDKPFSSVGSYASFITGADRDTTNLRKLYYSDLLKEIKEAR